MHNKKEQTVKENKEAMEYVPKVAILISDKIYIKILQRL